MSQPTIKEIFAEAKVLADAQSIDELFREPGDETDSWPLHKYLLYVFNTDGADWLEALVETTGCRYETLVDAAGELERLHFPHVAKILRKVADNARSRIDDIIEDELPDHWKRFGPEGVNKRKVWQLGQWLHERMKVTGRSRNELIAFYSLDESGWLTLGKYDYRLDAQGIHHPLAQKA